MQAQSMNKEQREYAMGSLLSARRQFKQSIAMKF